MATNITVITDTLNVSGVKGPRQYQGVFDLIPFKFSMLDTTIPAQGAAQADIDVPGAELGDFVDLSVKFDTTGLLISATVRAADVVEVTVFNTEGTDANTTLVAAREVNGLIRKPKANVYESF